MKKRFYLIATVIWLLSIAVAVIYAVIFWGVQDRTVPEIHMSQDRIEISVEATDADILAGVTAEDKKDGDLTQKLLVESLSNFVEKGKRIATIVVADSDNHVAKVQREVVYTDYQSPRFELTTPLMFQYGGTPNLDVVRVKDALDGDISENVQINSLDDSYIGDNGEHSMSFRIANSAGDVVTVPMTVEVYDAPQIDEYPRIELSAYLVYLSVGDSFEPWDYVKGVRQGNTFYRKLSNKKLENQSASALTIQNDVDTNASGVYEVVYRASIDRQTTGKMRLVVIVEEKGQENATEEK